MTCIIFHVECEALTVMHHLNVQHRMYVTPHIPCGMRSFMHHAPSQCLSTVCHVSYYIWNAKLYPSWTVSISNTVCHVSYSKWHVKLYVLCVISISNTVCHALYSMSNLKLYASWAKTISNNVCHVSYFIWIYPLCIIPMSNQYVMSYIPC